MTDWNDIRPNQYWTWPREAQYRYDERICIMREGNNIPDHEPTPAWIRKIATEGALEHV